MIINDRRSQDEISKTNILVVATDKFMSGWGHAKFGKSIFVVPCETAKQADKAIASLEARPEMKYVRVINGNKLPRGRKGDHISVCSMDNPYSR